MKRIYIDCGFHKFEIADKMIKGDNFDAYYLFEANPNLIDLDRYKDNPKVTIFNKAVWVEDGTSKFYLSKAYTTGSTIKTNKKTSSVDYANPVMVETIDFSKWVSDNFTSEDYIKLKMDIEGAEFDVLEKMIKDNSVQLVDEFLVEFHHNKIRDNNIVQRYKNIKNYFAKNKMTLKEHY